MGRSFGHRPAHDRPHPRRSLALRASAAGAALALIPFIGVTTATAAPGAQAASAAPAAHAALTAPLLAAQDYPSWADVQQAKKDQAAAKKAVERIKALIAQLAAQVAEANRVAEEKGAIYAQAQTAYDQQAFITDQLQTQADDAEAAAQDAQRSAGQLIAGLSRGTASDLTVQLFADGQNAEALLYNLAASQKFSETNQQLYDRAIQLQNTSSALGEQAEIARVELEKLREIAEEAFEEAIAAAQAAQIAYDEQLNRQGELEEQLAFLTDQTRIVQAEYEEGLRQQWGDGSTGYVSPAGWSNPTKGWISSHFGNRYHPIYHVWRLHSGTDIAGGGMGAPIYAASGGTVVYAAWYGDLGYYIKIDHGNGYVTGYAHIQTGGMLVRIGDRVAPGQQIAKVGSTGGSTGPHLHFMVYRNGVLTDPVPFMRDRGIQLGG